VQRNSGAARPLSISGGVGSPGGYRGVAAAGLSEYGAEEHAESDCQQDSQPRSRQVRS